jgi:hypothetical protein
MKYGFFHALENEGILKILLDLKNKILWSSDMKRKHDLRKLMISCESERIATRDFSPVKVTEYTYRVIDKSKIYNNKWKFHVGVPDKLEDKISVQPFEIPKGVEYAGLKRRAVMFMKSRKRQSIKKMYCETYISFQQLTGGGRKYKLTRRLLQTDMVPHMPGWFKRYYRRFGEIKSLVANINNSSENHGIFLTESDNYELMIRFYFILRVWTLERDIQQLLKKLINCRYR